jgi:hypothetical protein
MTSLRTDLLRGAFRSLGVMALCGAMSGALAHAETPASATPKPPASIAPSTVAPSVPASESVTPSASGGPPAPADPATAAPPASSSGGGAGADSGAYTVRLRSLEKNVNELKEQIFRTKARLNLLKETVLGGVIGASRAIIHHKNEMGSSFKLVKAAYALDGVQIYAKSDETGALAEMQDFDIYNGAIQPGSHTLSVALTYQGNGFGVFSYLKGYKFNVKSSHTFVAGDSKTTNITVVGYEKGNITTQLSDKPAVDFRVNVISAGEGGATAAAAKK